MRETPTYVIVYDDSADRHSAKRCSLKATAAQLSARIAHVQRKGGVVFGVQRDCE